ncbi:hypothetical protein [Actinopolymorpha pittospori]|uniref:hypothetical protein n=1 Tax=Actinopolymorpha pittospori TaxID=648752 RepID=UPI001789895A|nr:hypothetical protein [Actinopolymorpha pittospori]
MDIIGRAAGRRIVYRGTAGEFVAAQTAAGLPHESATAAARAFTALAGLGDAEPNDVVRRVTGREPKPFETYATEAAARGAWNV